MIIKKLQIQGYRSCLNTTFDLNPHLSVLIGPNSSGKTNLLNALLLLKKLYEEEDYYYGEEDPTGQCKLKAWFNIDDKKVILDATLYTFTDENNRDVIVSSKQKWYLKDFTGNAKRARLPLCLVRHYAGHFGIKGFFRRRLPVARHRYLLERVGKEPETIKEPLGVIAKYVSEMRYYSASQFTNPANCPVSFEIEKEGSRSRGLELQGHSKFLFYLYTEYKSESSGYQQFFDIIGPRGIGLVDNIDFEEILTSSIDYSVKSGGRVRKRKRDKILVIPRFSIGKHKLSPNQLSEGTFKTITLLFYLVTEASSILLIEEPEVCVHHGLLSSIIELIKTYSLNKQIVVSTHSDFVLDKVSPENVYKISSTPEQGTKASHIPKLMSQRELNALKKYLDTEGNLGEYWKHGALE